MKRPLPVPEQRTLFGGWDLDVPAAHGRRRVSVDERWNVGFATALAIVVEEGKQARAESGVPPRARCPHCGLIGDTRRDFGTRVVDGHRVAQSWCRDCRARHAASRDAAQADWVLALH